MSDEKAAEKWHDFKTTATGDGIITTAIDQQPPRHYVFSERRELVEWHPPMVLPDILCWVGP